MILKRALALCAPVTMFCGCTQERPQPIPVVAEQRQCPAFPMPPAALMVPPEKTDFLPMAGSPPKMR